jgi:two-component system OmpR family response regulator
VSPTAKPKARVLVVDNDPWIPRMAATILGQAGYLVNVAADAQGAIASAVKAPPRVILSAVTLPALDGRTWWERMRAIVDGRVIPFVFLTAPGVVPSDIRGFLSEIDDCLAKPFRVEELERKVRDALLRVPHPSVVPAASTESGEPPRPPMVTPVSTRASQWHRPLLALRGVLGEIGLGSLLVMLEMERKSGILIIETDTATARFFLRKGHIMRAELDGAPPVSGATAVYSALGWKEGQFEFLIGDVGGVDEIQTSTTFLLIEAARRADELKEQARESAKQSESLKGDSS